jgi:hypothetical protein
MKRILSITFLINFLAFGQQEIPFSNKKDELVKVVSYADGSFSIVTSNSVNWGKTISRFYNSNNSLINEVSLPPKVGVSCTINGFNNLQFPEKTAYHPKLKLTLMLGGISGPILPPQMVCRMLNENGQFSDLPFHNFKELNHELVTCEVYGNNLLVIYSTNHTLRQNEFWLAVVDLKNKVVRENKIKSSTEGIGSYIGFRDGRFYFLSNGGNSTTLNSINEEAKLEQTPIDFPNDLFVRQKYSKEVNRVIEAIHPVKYYTDLPGDKICFMLYGRESFICNITPDNQVVYQPILIPDSLKVVNYIPGTDIVVDFRKAVIVDTKNGIELLISNTTKNSYRGSCSLGRWQIQWDYSETAEPLDIHGDLMLGTPLDMIAYSSKNPQYTEWKESQDQKQEGVLLMRTLEDFDGSFSFIEFSSTMGQIPLKAILYK